MGFIKPLNQPESYRQQYQFFTPKECKDLSKILLRDERMVLDIPNEDHPYYTGLTVQHNVYNWLDNEDLLIYDIPKRLFRLPEFQQEEVLYVQCWANILRQGENIPDHIHGFDGTNPHHGIEDQFYACNIFIDGPIETGTYYNDTYERNTIGQMELLGSKVPHGVRTHMSHTPRISMAMDIYHGGHPIIQHSISQSETHFITDRQVQRRMKRITNRYKGK